MVRLFLRFSGDRWRKHFDYVNYNSILASRRRKRPLGAVRSPRSNEHFGIIEGREEKRKKREREEKKKKKKIGRSPMNTRVAHRPISKFEKRSRINLLINL